MKTEAAELGQVRHFKAFWLEFVVPPPEQPREGAGR